MSTADGAVIGTTQIFGSAPRNRAFNVVLLGDGFKAAEQAAFDAACNAFLAAFRATPPYDQLTSAINVFRVNVRSTDSGADDPTATGGTGATARTYFDASFGANGIRRLLVCNDSTALQTAAAQVPEFTVVLVVVNSTIYGGSGGSIGTYSLASGATEIAIHEMGHTAYGLADEYPYYAGGNETGHDRYSGGEPAEPNVTANSNRATLKWRWAVAAATAVPTMRNPTARRSTTGRARSRRAHPARSRAPTTSTAARSGRSTTARCATSASRSARSAARSSGTASGRWSRSRAATARRSPPSRAARRASTSSRPRATAAP